VADEQVAGQQPFQLGVGAGVGPGADDFGADQLFDAEGGRGAFGALGMAVGGTGGDDGSWIIGLGDLEQGMVGAAGQDGAQEQGFEPG
jgi:hypothetical protein